jgi:hypothetical protein
MPAVPLFLAGLPVTAYARLDSALATPMGPIAGFAICRDAEGGFYLFGCDDDWNTVADTWHQALDDALHQAEYEGVGDMWEWPDGRPA